MTKTPATKMVAPIVAALCWLGSGCQPPEEAPTELNELSSFLFAHWEDEDDTLRAQGLQNLYAFFEDVDLSQGYNDLAYGLDPLTDEDIDVPHPDADPEDQLPVGLVTPSAFTPAEHAEVIVLEDQTPVEPNSPDTYDRDFHDPSDPSCFPSRDCTVIRSLNDIVKDNAIMTIPYEMDKDFRWVPIRLDDEDTWAILGRSWCEEPGYGDQGNTSIDQSYSIDVFLPGEGGAIRYMALWSASTIPGVEEDVIQGTITFGMHQIFDATEEYLEDNL